MTNQPFDGEVSEARKKHGMEVAAENSGEGLKLAQGIARELCRKYGETDADRVGRLLFVRHGISTLGPAAGSIFKGGEFEMTGERRKSTRKSNHAREIKVWRLVGK